jgi:hypothetical protein
MSAVCFSSSLLLSSEINEPIVAGAESINPAGCGAASALVYAGLPRAFFWWACGLLLNVADHQLPRPGGVTRLDPSGEEGLGRGVLVG